MPEVREVQDQQQWSSLKPFELVQSLYTGDQHLRDLEKHEANMIAFCGIWEDHPRHQFRTEFCIENGQLVGYSEGGGSKALAMVDGDFIQMIIVHAKETGRPLDDYRGRLSRNRKYIEWEKQDSSRKGGWRPTRKWVKIE